MDIMGITQVNAKYYWLDGKRQNIKDGELFAIMCDSHEQATACTRVIDEMRPIYENALQVLSNMEHIPEARFYAGISIANMDAFTDMQHQIKYAGYVDGLRDMLNHYYHRREHCRKIYEQAKRAYYKI